MMIAQDKIQINREVFIMEYITLSNGVKMPQLGYGVFQVTQEECERCVLDALKVGYRAIDTAQSYFNEAQVGAAIEKSGIERKDIFLTTKVWIEHYGYDAAKASILDSMKNCAPTTLTSACCISLMRITTVHGGHWKSCTKRARFVLSACLTSTRIVWWTSAPLHASNQWSIR